MVCKMKRNVKGFRQNNKMAEKYFNEIDFTLNKRKWCFICTFHSVTLFSIH